MKKILLALACASTLAVRASADQCEFTENWDDRFIATIVIDDEVVPLEMAFEDYQFMLFDACRALGLMHDDVCTTYPLMGEIGENALATRCSGVPKIIYDRRLSSQVGFFGAQAILAHELGHILCGHLDAAPSILNAHVEELEADQFAGALMRLLGYSEIKALSFAPLLSEQPSLSHPGRDAREEAMRQGWRVPDVVQACISRSR